MADAFRLGEHSPKKVTGGVLGSQKKRSAKAQANAHEQELAEKLGGFRQPCSGAFGGQKGDVKLEHFLLDEKETNNNSIIITREMLLKITREALQDSREPGLVIRFNEMNRLAEREWVMFPISVFVKMLEAGQDQKLNQLEGENHGDSGCIRSTDSTTATGGSGQFGQGDSGVHERAPESDKLCGVPSGVGDVLPLSEGVCSELLESPSEQELRRESNDDGELGDNVPPLHADMDSRPNGSIERDVAEDNP